MTQDECENLLYSYEQIVKLTESDTIPPITPLPMGSACVHVIAGWSYHKWYC